MIKEHEIAVQVRAAQADRQAADDLIQQYLPFIRSETAKCIKGFPADGQDELSIAMFAFYEAILSYQAGRGAFLKFAAAAIRNRLIDHFRKEQRHGGAISLDAPAAGEDGRPLSSLLPDQRDELASLQERAAVQTEIREFSDQLQRFGLSLSDIAENCPKQSRTLYACMRALDYARAHPALLDRLVQSGKLPLSQLAEGAQVERKTLERHRRYLMAILLAYTNGFEILRGHLRIVKREEASCP